jgi:multidrug efflux pump subunit AcrA (membrane-fusion protein)
MRVAENLKLSAEAQLVAADRAVASAGSAEAKEQTEDAKAKAAARAAELQAQWAAAQAELQPKFDAAASAREATVIAENARVAAAEAALDLEPVSVFITRKTQRLYVRQAFQPILETPVTIRDSDRPIGTHVFTAIERAGRDRDIRWSVVSLNGGNTDASTRPGPQDALERIAEIASPRSSLIISDEELSSETGKDTEFVVIMSGEPQGGIKFRRRGPEVKVRYERPAIACHLGPRHSQVRFPPGNSVSLCHLVHAERARRVCGGKHRRSPE